MDEIKQAYRKFKTSFKKTARGVDGTNLNDRAGNAGDSARESLGNLGDHVRGSASEPQGAKVDPARTSERPM